MYYCFFCKSVLISSVPGEIACPACCGAKDGWIPMGDHIDVSEIWGIYTSWEIYGKYGDLLEKYRKYGDLWKIPSGKHTKSY